ncbi:MAG: hypothetical protein ABSB95_02770 [Dissulfurispiraceae bacterium]
MRKRVANSEYIETGTVMDLKLRKTPGSYNRHNIGTDSEVSNHKRSIEKRYPQLRNCVWSCHLITMLTSHGRPIWIFTVIDEHTQEYLLCLAAHHISAQNIIDELFRLFLQRGIPRYLFAFNDNGAITEAICEWIEKLDVDSPFVEPKRYEEHGYGTMFRETFMKDISGQKRLASLCDVRLWLENWRNEHNRSINLLHV